MKKILSILFVLSVAFALNAAAPTWSGTDASPWWNRDQTISSTADYDTITGDDSLAVLSNFYPEPGFEYILQRDALTGTGADSAKIGIYIDSKDANNNVYYRTTIDSITAAAGEAYKLPFGETLFGTKFDVKFKTYSDAGVVVVNRVELWMRRAVQKVFKQ